MKQKKQNDNTVVTNVGYWRYLNAIRVISERVVYGPKKRVALRDLEDLFIYWNDLTDPETMGMTDDTHRKFLSLRMEELYAVYGIE